MIVVDSSAIVATVAPNDPNYRRANQVFARTHERFIIPLGIMSEAAYMIESRLGDRALDAVLTALERGEQFLDCGDRDIPRIRQLIRRYANLPLGYADASVIACAERLGGRILTFDHHVRIVAGEGTITLVPTP